MKLELRNSKQDFFICRHEDTPGKQGAGVLVDGYSARSGKTFFLRFFPSRFKQDACFFMLILSAVRQFHLWGGISEARSNAGVAMVELHKNREKEREIKVGEKHRMDM